MQDGLDLIDALARHPATATRLATRLYQFFVNDVDAPDAGRFVSWPKPIRATNGSIRAVLQRLFLSERFLSGSNCVPALRMAGRVRRAIDQGSRVARVVRGLGHQPRCRTWGSSCTSRQT